MNHPNIVCLIIDRLQLGYVGGFGNTWVQTPELDRLASESFACDQAFVTGTQRRHLYPLAFWQGQHPWEPEIESELRTPLPLVASRMGYDTVLVSDEPEVRVVGEPWFNETIAIEPEPASTSAAEIDETRLAAFFAESCDALQAWQAESSWRPYFMWLHTRGLAPPWDAPLSLRENYLEDEDERAPDFVQVPDFQWPVDFDPDERLGYQRAYAAQVATLDACLAPFFDLIREPAEGEPPLLIVASARGYALGEHRFVGGWDTHLQEEIVHIPWWIRFPDRRAAGRRTQALVQTSDLPATLIDFWKSDPAVLATHGQSLLPLIEHETARVRDRLVIVGDQTSGVRTPAWYLRTPPPTAEGLAPPAELYVKPEDRWEVNDVARRCPEIVEALVQLGSDAGAAIAAGTPQAVEPLSDVLARGPD